MVSPTAATAAIAAADDIAKGTSLLVPSKRAQRKQAQPVLRLPITEEALKEAITVKAAQSPKITADVKKEEDSAATQDVTEAAITVIHAPSSPKQRPNPELAQGIQPQAEVARPLSPRRAASNEAAAITKEPIQEALSMNEIIARFHAAEVSGDRKTQLEFAKAILKGAPVPKAVAGLQSRTAAERQAQEDELILAFADYTLKDLNAQASVARARKLSGELSTLNGLMNTHQKTVHGRYYELVQQNVIDLAQQETDLESYKNQYHVLSAVLKTSIAAFTALIDKQSATSASERSVKDVMLKTGGDYDEYRNLEGDWKSQVKEWRNHRETLQSNLDTLDNAVVEANRLMKLLHTKINPMREKAKAEEAAKAAAEAAKAAAEAEKANPQQIAPVAPAASGLYGYMMSYWNTPAAPVAATAAAPEATEATTATAVPEAAPAATEAPEATAATAVVTEGKTE